jgi:hypothetical protein
MQDDIKKYKVIISERAIDMMTAHIRFLAQVSEEAAIRLKTEFIKQARSLENLPERGSWITNIYLPANKYRKLKVENRYLIIYQVKDDSVFVDYMVDCRRDFQWLL